MTSNFSRNPASIFAGPLCAVLVTACSTAVHLNDQSGTEAQYKFGYLWLKPAQPVEKLHAAAIKAFKDLGYLETGDDVLPDEIKVSAEDWHDTETTVELKNYNAYTLVKIRYGSHGDLAKEQNVYRAIERNF
jgi:hypothetical protein